MASVFWTRFAFRFLWIYGRCRNPENARAFIVLISRLRHDSTVIGNFRWLILDCRLCALRPLTHLHLDKSYYFCRQIVVFMVLYLFNPDNDLALGNNSIYYQAPASALKMASDLAFLPAWIVSAADAVVAVPDRESIKAWVKQSTLVPQIRWGLLEEELAVCDAVCPWGWNGALIRRLKMQGADPSLLPTCEELERLRHMSSRLRAVDLLSALTAALPGLCGSACACRSLEDVERAIRADGQVEWRTKRKLMKAPWSGSGKGLRWADNGVPDTAVRNWCRRVLAAQGLVIVEPFYRKVLDFAMEFWSEGDGRFVFVGYSLFGTDGNGAYKGNELRSDASIEREITRFIPVALLDAVRLKIESCLPMSLQHSYRGFLGVDMMVCAFDAEPFYRLHPCVEINLRMNMGIVAHTLYNKWVSPRSEGVFRIDFFKSPQLLLEDHQMQTHAHPLVMQDGRVSGGYLPLTPVGRDTLYRAALWVAPING